MRGGRLVDSRQAMPRLSLAMIALWAPVAHCWATAQLHAPAHSSLQLRARRSVQPRACDADVPEMTEADLERRVRRSDLDVAAAGAATGAEISDEDKTEGIPNYLLRFSGTVDRLTLTMGGVRSVPDDSLPYSLDETVRTLTSELVRVSLTPALAPPLTLPLTLTRCAS